MCADKNSDEIRTLSYLLNGSGEKEPESVQRGFERIWRFPAQ